jgi:glycyl-tRNA synthetase beta chain
MARDLLIEIGTEELPPKALASLSAALTNTFCSSLKVEFGKQESYATPRRLAILVKDVAEDEPDRTELKLGPTTTNTKACEGFAKSNNTTVDKLSRVPGNKEGEERVAYTLNIPGRPASVCIVESINQALELLPIAKRMRWGASRAEFVRPVHWIVLLFGKEVIDATILGIKTGNQSRGHRFHAPEPFTVSVSGYEKQMAERKVIANFASRRETIRQQVMDAARKAGGSAVIDEELLDEVTALVEWPVALTGNFEPRFLEVPAEALVSSMKGHQKYFHLVDGKGKLMPHFITISNLDSKDPAQVIQGNERVIRPRLTDAAFFFATDRKRPLASRCETLKGMVFQQQLGSLHDKSLRVSALAGEIACRIGGDPVLAKRAGELCKADLVTQMVFEFAELQGVMGCHYAHHDGEPEEVATALFEQYLPKGAGDELPQTATGQALALADRIDTLIGIFGIGQQPTGNKDPFALRRATIGIINIMVERQLPLDLEELYSLAFALYPSLPVADAVQRALDYTIERFRAHYQGEGFATESYLAVVALKIYRPLDFDRRIRAVHAFGQLPEAAALASANKRVANILTKQEVEAGEIAGNIDQALLKEPAEIALVSAFRQREGRLGEAVAASNYSGVLSTLAELKPEIDQFFDSVMVMAEDSALRKNRLVILKKLRSSFLQVADISQLAQK